MLRLALCVAAFCAALVQPAEAEPRCALRSMSIKEMLTLTSSTEFVDGHLTENGVQTESQPYDRHEALSASAISATNFRRDLLTLVNIERSRRNLRTVCLNSKLSLAAQRHANDMAVFNYFSHTGRDGFRFTQRITAAGFRWSSAGEIIAAGQTSAISVMNSWMNSTGHRAIILGAGYTFLGGGYAYDPTSRFKHYWVQEFATGSTEVCDL